MTRYDAGFYRRVRRQAQQSAEVIVPLVCGYLPSGAWTIDTVVDVGCGEGWFAKAFQDRGCRVLGMDGEYALDTAVVPFQAVDLTSPPVPIVQYDLAVCLEVAEHLPATCAPGLVDFLCSLADTILFSAAIPGQGGTHHVNCQWPEYWVSMFHDHGYEVSGALRWPLWNDERVAGWYRQNLLVCSRVPERHPGVFSPRVRAYPYALVHPAVWNSTLRRLG